MSAAIDPQPHELDELDVLRARVAQLEAELIDVEARSNRTIGELQAQTYWLERWGVDLDALMRRPAANRARAAARFARGFYRRGLRVKRRLLS